MFGLQRLHMIRSKPADSSYILHIAYAEHRAVQCSLGLACIRGESLVHIHYVACLYLISCVHSLCIAFWQHVAYVHSLYIAYIQVGKQYRAPQFVATSFQKRVAQGFVDRVQINDFVNARVIWKVELDPVPDSVPSQPDGIGPTGGRKQD